ncbi:hypothetical protein [Streptomyces sp. NBC_01363]|uniref:hypothetical protein n=1 Tax=Streptomyces sp. NBC_01363 TaxID=2903840 RepID=UPI0022540D37|nr:hypothetical protein [Streptomyces sp. NBC_01363]MCX4736574.1 hypothetical protein [Streptomyces sp. NBC_01363]
MTSDGCGRACHRATTEKRADVAPPPHSCDSPDVVTVRAPAQLRPDQVRTTRMQYVETHAQLIAVPSGRVVDEE